MFDFLEEMVEVLDQQIALYQDHEDWFYLDKVGNKLTGIAKV
jgi:hypothetical protein